MRVAIALPSILAATLIAGCSSESEVYQANLKPYYISPYARRLSSTELDQIARLMAHTTRKPIIALTGSRNLQLGGKILVTVGYPAAQDPDGFGFGTLEKSADAWRVATYYDRLSPVLVRAFREQP